MAPKTMTTEALKGLINEIVEPLVGSTIDERLKAHQAKESGAILSAIQGLNAPKAKEPKKGHTAAAIILSIAAARMQSQKGGGHVTAVDQARKFFGPDHAATKGLVASTGTEGGFLIPEEVSEDFIELLRARSIVRALNPTVVPMNLGNLTMRKLTGGATGGYIGEAQNIPKSQQTVGQVKLSAKKLATLVPISNDLLRRTPNGDTLSMVRDDTVAFTATHSDSKFIRSVGGAFSPRGLRHRAVAANVIAANASVDLANTTTDLGKLWLALADEDVRFLRPGWMFSPRTFNYLMTVRDGNGNYAFRDELMGGTLWGYPFGWTTSIPSNLGGGTDESEVYLVDFADVVIGETTQVLIDISSEAAYHDGSGVVAAFSTDETVIRTIVEHDIGLRHDESVAVLTEVTWT